MRIALVRRGFSATGGAEAYLLRLADGLAAAGHAPVLVTSAAWPDAAWRHGGVVRLPGSTPSAFAAAFGRWEGGVDVSLSLDRTPGCDVVRAGDGVHAAWLRRRAAFEPRWKAWLRRWNPKHGAMLALERAVFASARLVVANSRMVADEILHWHGIGAARLRVVYNGFSGAWPAVDRAAARERLGIGEDVHCAAFVGTGWERKGLRFAVEAVRSLPGPAVLVVAGRGDPSRFRGPRVLFLGATHDLGGLFAAADLFVLPTVYDPFSNACLEALAAGLPVVTTDANGVAEVLAPGVDGEVVPVGDVAALAAAMQRWRGREARAACRAKAAEFPIARNVSETLGALEAATRKSARQTRAAE